MLRASDLCVWPAGQLTGAERTRPQGARPAVQRGLPWCQGFACVTIHSMHSHHDRQIWHGPMCVHASAGLDHVRQKAFGHDSMHASTCANYPHVWEPAEAQFEVPTRAHLAGPHTSAPAAATWPIGGTAGTYQQLPASGWLAGRRWEAASSRTTTPRAWRTQGQVPTRLRRTASASRRSPSTPPRPPRAWAPRSALGACGRTR